MLNHSRRRTAGEIIAFITLCFAALVACKKKEGDTCSINSDCAKGLYCVDADPAERKCMTEAQGNAACRAASVCTENGKCTVDHSTGNCLAKSDADCEQSTGCKTGGQCKVAGTGYCGQ